PSKSHKPRPIGSVPFMAMLTICGICILFILWRRADSLRRIVSHQLKTFSRSAEGQIRLSNDDGPTVEEFLADDSDDE
ncbi:hypothetical protein FISHEDRAFT_26758, partial [Fistulina hepatica ATCC 64428]